MADQTKKRPMRIRDDATISEIYCSKYVGLTFDGDAVNVTLGSMRLVPEKTDTAPGPGDHPEIFVNARIALSKNAAIELVNALTNLLGHLSSLPGSDIQHLPIIDPKKAN